MTIDAVLGRVLVPPLGSKLSVAAPIWWTNNGAIPAPVAAYRAVNTPGSAWGAGPATLAASYINLANAGTYNLTVGSAPGWSGARGWIASGSHYLRTGVIPQVGPTFWSVVIRVANVPGSGVMSALGMYVSTNASFYLSPSYVGNRVYYDGTAFSFLSKAGGAFAEGTMGFAAKTAYKDGATDGTIAAGNGVNPAEIYILASKIDGSPGQYLTGDVLAVWIANYNASAYMANLHTIMMAL